MPEIPNSRIRKLRTWLPGKRSSELIGIDENKNQITLIDLASNDYLDLARHPLLIEATRQIIETDGVGSGGSRFITGSRNIHQKLETKLTEWLDREIVLLYPSGFQANLAAVLALADRHTPVICDRLIHHSLLVGVKASGAKLIRFKHNNLFELETLLEKSRQNNPKKQPLVITESLFSMEGTTAPIKEISKLCIKYDSKLLIDEAHAFGVMGPEGKGESFGIKEPISIISGTFGKAFGSGGAFLATDKVTGENLIQNCGAFRYTTALAPPLCASALAALNLIESNPSWGSELKEKSKDLRDRLSQIGWQRPIGGGPIISIILGSDELAMDYQKRLEAQGLLTVAIRPPTVPEGESRLRLVIRRNTPVQAFERLIAVLKDK
ncbi:aminotransferase class I/II-fold pyridoxal phosphate-dependent enzyme [Prochlorococcus marinus]|uniref:8-amino-7-oxononanoate synthase n=1 Tax=Prochlorococcus marinus XMU1408 TaxID=2213228 RepID=A0A318R7N8_PROMR|nr:pyridoxal phosphate-dependent aminotransferase family protein [Prochlorococcus marinus]MBW3042643.1 8-amino-7-oxononanoate synthase [Prochlorococcus marinus str. XMU1408]PYE01338.1 8-amino-7-oxononanoate synthase [Prochlorococcus marinus XMU1408]